jgi:hypothetical protein
MPNKKANSRRGKKAAKRARFKHGAARAKSKIAKVVAMLQRPEGVTLTEIMVATGWQAHTVRGAIAGTLKKRLGYVVVSEKIDGIRTYRVTGPKSSRK